MTSRINNPDTDADIALRQCIDTMNSFIMVAGAGSGKTTSLVKGLSYVSKKYGEILRQKKQRVACITYTKVAEKEILNDVDGDALFHVSTIHSFLWELVKPFQTDIKQWVINRIEIKISEVKEKQNNYGSRVHQSTKEKDHIELEKNILLASEINSVSVFKYETGSNYKNGILGHSDIIKMVPEIIETKPLLRKIIIQKYPFVFVDESQDTLQAVVKCLIDVDQDKKNNFCLGFFGDPMQKIYVTGVGEITLQANWKNIIKPENFRCPTNVLKIINNIRNGGDGLQQSGGRTEIVEGKYIKINGTARLFVLQADENRIDNLRKVRDFVAKSNNDNLWLQEDDEYPKIDDADLKILVIEHRMAAKRLGFEDLHFAFKEKSTESMSITFSEGTNWALLPFQRVIIPLTKACKTKDNFNVINLLREYSPHFQKEYLKSNKITAKKLAQFNDKINLLNTLFDDEKTTVKSVLKFVEENYLITLDERISARLNDLPLEVENENALVDIVIQNYFNCPVRQILGYYKYINDESPYSTQHSIKGAEFKRVLVILDDEEGAKSTLYSYEKLLGLKKPSETDTENLVAGNDSVFGRTRRLFYVCCSRAVKDLVVVLFVKDVNSAMASAETSSIFSKDDIFLQKDIA